MSNMFMLSRKDVTLERNFAELRPKSSMTRTSIQCTNKGEIYRLCV